jgi:rhodanese-related sulfurtransferase
LDFPRLQNYFSDFLEIGEFPVRFSAGIFLADSKVEGARSLRMRREAKRKTQMRPGVKAKTTQPFQLIFNHNFQNMVTATIESAEKAKEFFARKLDFTISPEELNDEIEKGGKNFIVDVREAKDFIKGHIPCAINLPLGHWDKMIGWRKDRPIIIYGYSQLCHLAAHAAKESAEHGYTVLELEGGFDAWRKSKLAVEY